MSLRKQVLARMIAVALAVGVGVPVLAQERPRDEREQEFQSEEEEVRRVARSRQTLQEIESQGDATQGAQVQTQGGGQEYSPEQPNQRALELRQIEEAQAQQAQREAAAMQVQAEQDRRQQEYQADQQRAQAQQQAEQAAAAGQRQAEQMQVERERQAEQFRSNQQRQGEQVQLQRQRQDEQVRQVEQRQAEQDRNQVQRGADGRRMDEFHQRNSGLGNELEPRRTRFEERGPEQYQAGQGRYDGRDGYNNPREYPVSRELSRLSDRERQTLISQQRQSADRYRRDAFREQRAEQQYAVALQQQQRMQQSLYQKHYWERQHQMQTRWSSQRFNYDSNPYFYTRANYRYQRGGRYYQVNRYAADLLQQAIRYGYEEGARAGEADRYDGWRGGYRDNYAYIDANFGYEGYYVSQRDYNHYFREGFRRGYEDGFGRRYRYGRYDDGEYSIQSSVLQLILRLEPFG